jgi:hypothetical protein
MKTEEYLYVCLVFSIVFVVHSGISYLALRSAPSGTAVLRVKIERMPFK